MSPLKYTHYHNPPWEYDVVVCYGPISEANRFVWNITGDSDVIPSDCRGFCYTTKGNPIVVWVDDIKSVVTLVHELMHAVFHLLGNRGLALSDESEEAYTYTLSSLLRRILDQKKWMTLK